jgi:hypothetical protein
LTSQAAPVVPVGVFAAAVAAQEHWVETEAARLTCVDQAYRERIAAQLKPAATRSGADWAFRFGVHVLPFTLSSGLVFASVIGATLWAARIPGGQQAAAAATAAAYLMIAVVAFPVGWSQGHRILEQLERVSSNAPRDFLALYLAVMPAAALLYGIVNASTRRTSTSRAEPPSFYVSEFAAFAVVTALGWLLAYLITTYAVASGLRKSSGSQSLTGAVALAATVVTAWVPARTSPLQAGNLRVDAALLRLLRCTVSIDRLGQQQGLASPQHARSVIFCLELAAADMEQYAVARVPRSDTVTRRAARLHGARLASPVRDAKVPLACAVDSGDYVTVATRLAGFLQGWPGSGQGDPSATSGGGASAGWLSLGRRMAMRAWNAVLLAAAAVFLPLAPIYDNDHAAAASLRYALLTAAVLSLVTHSGTTADTIQRNLEGTLPGARAS